MKRISNMSHSISFVPLALAASVALAGCSMTYNGQTTFRKPDQAVQAMSDLIGAHDPAGVEKLFGASGAELLDSGDSVADQQAAAETKELIQQKVAFEDLDDDTKVAVLGDEAWPFAIPLVKKSGRWHFDSEAGREELANRRVGANELSTLATLHAAVDAQREYFRGRHDGRTKAYAARFLSTPGKQDGLYWDTAEGAAPSPLGPLIAEAAHGGYDIPDQAGAPYHGYHFRMLSAQGADAPGGAKSYADKKGALTKGFAILAWPAKYGNSGIMTFQVSSRGIVFQKDLGEETESLVADIKAYNPDSSWAPDGD